MKNAITKIFTLLFIIVATTLSGQEKTTTISEVSIEIKANDTDEELEAMAKIFAKDNINLKFSKVKRNANGEIISIKSSYKGPKGFEGEYKISAPVAISSFNFSVKYSDDDAISDISYNRNKKGDIIAMNTDGKSSIYMRIKNKDKTNENQPLYVIDNKISEETDIKENLKPDDIKSMNVLKGKSAKEKYGDKGENGVIEITTKKNIVIKTVNEDSELNSIKPLYIIDGKVMPNYYNPSELKTDTIESMNVLKGKSATEIYGDKGKNGVIVIKLKK